jgi:putative glutamine amidotransferase
MSKPVIGIAPDFTGTHQEPGKSEATILIRNRYVAAIEAAGGIPLILPIVTNRALCKAVLDQLDGLLLTGSGPDIDPRRYGERKRFAFKVMSAARTDSEYALVAEARKRDIPVLGICGGMQLMNVALGGTLIQDIDKQVVHPLSHRLPGPASTVSHEVRIKPGTRLSAIVGRSSIRVNSSHHQAVKALSRALRVSASAPDGVIEALEDPRRRFFIGVQWHPEYLYGRHAVHRAIFRALITAAHRQPVTLRSVRQA